MTRRLHTIDDVIQDILGRDLYTRRTLMENLREGRKFHGCAGKLGSRWVFDDEGVELLLDRIRGAVDLDAPASEPSPPGQLRSGMSPRSPRARRSA